MSPDMPETSRTINLLDELARRDRIDAARRRGAYSTLGMLLQRKAATSLCIDPDCRLSGGYSHAGDCEPCGCGLDHARGECPADLVHAAARSGGDGPQCGWSGGSVKMTFRDAEARISPSVTCCGCQLVEARRPPGSHTVTFPEEDRQLLLLALSDMTFAKPGFAWAVGQLADRIPGGREMLEGFRQSREPGVAPVER